MFLTTLLLVSLLHCALSFSFKANESPFSLPPPQRLSNSPNLEVHTAVQGVKASVEDVKSDMTDVKGKVDKVTAQVQSVFNKFEKMEKANKARSDTAVQVKKKVKMMEENMKTKFSKLDKTLDSLTIQIKDIKTDDDSKKEVESAASKAAKTEEKVRMMVDTMNSKFSELEKDLGSVEQKIIDIKKADDAKTKEEGKLAKSRGARSCEEVKSCGGVTEDGEFWLYPPSVAGQRAKVYCAHMDTDEPKEYLSLNNNNYGFYPSGCDWACKHDNAKKCPSRVHRHAGYVEYMKIRIDLNTLVVDKEDQSFTEGNGTRMEFGKAGDCYNAIWHEKPDPTDMSCGPKGRFQIDVAGTGFRVSKKTTWKTSGWKHYMSVQWSRDQTNIRGFCGGWEGYCEASEIRLESLPTEEVKGKGVKEIRCRV